MANRIRLMETAGKKLIVMGWANSAATAARQRWILIRYSANRVAKPRPDRTRMGVARSRLRAKAVWALSQAMPSPASPMTEVKKLIGK